MIALQNHYNLMHRGEFEGDLARVAAQQRLGVMPRFALASGFLTGKYRTKADLAGNGRGREVARYLNKRGLRVIAMLDDIAAELSRVSEKRIDTASVAIAWLLTKPHIVAPVVSASRPEQVRSLASAVRLQLSRHQVAALDRVSA